MTTSPVHTSTRLPWRRSALACGAAATVAWIALLTPLVRYGPSADQNLGVSLAAVVLSFGTTHLLVRMWAGPEYRSSNNAVLGRRLAHAFEILFAISIVVGFVDLPDGSAVEAVLVVAILGSFFGALVLALPRPEPSPLIG
jgi:hypothetical protein